MEDRFQKIFASLSRQVSMQSFDKYILHSSQHMQDLFTSIRECRTQGFPRFNIWRMLLEVTPIGADLQAKKSAVELSRKRWAEVKEEARTGIKPSVVKEVVLPKNPLMKVMVKTEKKEQSSDSFLNQEIKKDVDRTYQELQFFQDPQILKLLTSVLFVWCKLNADVSYKQGMNQLLASIVFVYFQEAAPVGYEASSPIEESYLVLNSVAHAEADIFTVFERIMDIQKEMYKENLDGDVKGLVNPNSKNNSPILQRIIQIQDQKLKSLDLQLFRILKLQDVKTKTFLLRWIRCLHTREFGLVNSLFIWDSIFLDAYESPNSKSRHQYQFVDAMCLAMFIYLRVVVVTRETANEILKIYQKYPALEGQFLFELVRLAWSVCEELRNLANNPASNSNWYDDSEKIKKLGLMGKGGYAETIKKQEVEEKKRMREEEELTAAKETEQFVKEKDAIFIKKTVSKTEKAENNGELFSNKNKLDILSRKGQQTTVQQKQEDNELFIRHKQALAKRQQSTINNNKKISFQYQQLKGLVQLLKKSIDLNDDIESRALANNTLKVLQSKLSS